MMNTGEQEELSEEDKRLGPGNPHYDFFDPICKRVIDEAVRDFNPYWRRPEILMSTSHFHVMQFRPRPSVKNNDLDLAMEKIQTDVQRYVSKASRALNGIKVWPMLYVRYESANPLEENFKTFEAYLPAASGIFFPIDRELECKPHGAVLQRLADRLLASNAKFIRHRSGLVLAEIYSLNLNIVRFNPLDGCAWAPLPKFLANKKAIVNVQNTDDRCFGYALASALNPVPA